MSSHRSSLAPRLVAGLASAAAAALSLALAASCGGRIASTGTGTGGGGGAAGFGNPQPIPTGRGGSGGFAGSSAGTGGGVSVQPCGPTVCYEGTYCCSTTCGYCAQEGAPCPAIACGGAGGVAGSGVAGAAGAGPGLPGCDPQTNQYLVCPAVEACACMVCGTQEVNCYYNSGCQQIVVCAEKLGCQGANCYAPNTCQSVIDANGGPSGASATAALDLYNCMQGSGCSLSCNGGTGGAGGAGGAAGGSGGFAGTGTGGGGGMLPGTTTCTFEIKPPIGDMNCSTVGGVGGPVPQCTAQCNDQAGQYFSSNCIGNQCSCKYGNGACQCADADPNSCGNCCPYVSNPFPVPPGN